MIHVIVKEKANQIVDLTIDGHANSAEHGQDLVCAGVSASGVGILNSLVQYGFLEDKEMSSVNKESPKDLLDKYFNKVEELSVKPKHK